MTFKSISLIFSPLYTTFHHFGAIIIIRNKKIIKRLNKKSQKKAKIFSTFSKKSSPLPKNLTFFHIIICVFTFFYISFNFLLIFRVVFSPICQKIGVRNLLCCLRHIGYICLKSTYYNIIIFDYLLDLWQNMCYTKIDNCLCSYKS